MDSVQLGIHVHTVEIHGCVAGLLSVDLANFLHVCGKCLSYIYLV